MIRTLAARLLPVIACALVAACTATPAASPAASAVPSVALTVQEQIAATVTGIDGALAAYRAGDATLADQLAGDAYLEHFEFVEGPLEAVDHELTEEIEELIRDELRAAIQAGRPVAEVEGLVNEAKTLLATALTKL